MLPLTIPGINNGYDVDGKVWRGAQPADSVWSALAAAGCKSVVDLNSIPPEIDRQQSLVVAAGMAYASHDWSSIFPPILSKIDAALATIDSEINLHRSPLFVHCHEGSDRTGVLCACWRIHHDGWTVEKAIEEAFFGLGFHGLHEFWFGRSVEEYAHGQGKK